MKKGILVWTDKLDFSCYLPTVSGVQFVYTFKLLSSQTPGDLLFTYIQVFNLLFQFLSTHESIYRWNISFSFFQPFLEGSNQLPEFIQLLLAS